MNEISPEIQITKKWADDDPRSLLIDENNFHMIIMDLDPWTKGEEDGFKALMQTTSPQYHLKTEKFYRCKLDSSYQKNFDLVKSILKSINFLSFTADHWTNDANVVCLMSLTVHFVVNHAKCSLVLRAIPFDERHIAANISAQLQELLQAAEIPTQKVQKLVRDNAASMRAAMSLAQVPDLSCFLHTLQLAIGDGLKAQDNVQELIEAAKSIVRLIAAQGVQNT